MENYTEVFAWGLDNKGQLGLGVQSTFKSINTPRFCSYNIMIHSVSCGEEHSGFISDSGHIYMMGSNLNGKLGINDKSIPYTSSPYLVESLEHIICSQISCGSNHTAVVSSSSVLYTWGLGQYGALGTGDYETRWSPVEVLKNVQAVSCGSRHTASIQNSTLMVCGNSDAGQLGTGKRTTEVAFVAVPNLKALQVCCGEFHTGIISTDHQVFMTGGNSFGQLGIGSKKSTSTVIKLDLPKALKISCGNHSACITSEGLYVWGSSVFGEYLVPKKVKVSGSQITDISIGGSFGVAIDSDLKVFLWGTNSNGELAQGDFQSRPGPVQVTYLKNKKIGRVSAGGNFCICLGQGSDKGLARTQSIGLSAREDHEEQYTEERIRQVNVTKELDELHRLHVETKENFQSKLKKANEELQLVSSEASNLKQTLSEANSQMIIIKNENSALKEENFRLKKMLEQMNLSARNEPSLNKIQEDHFLQIQEIQNLLDKEKVLKKQVERDLEVAFNHRQRLENTLNELRETESQMKDKSRKLELQVKELTQEKGKILQICDEFKEKIAALEGTLQDMFEENKFYSETMRESAAKTEKNQRLLKETEDSYLSSIVKVKHQDGIIQILSQENKELKLMLNELENTVQDLLKEKEQEIISKTETKPHSVLTPKIPNLKGLMPQVSFLPDTSLSTNRKNLCDGQKERLRKAAEKLVENYNPESPLKNLRVSSPNRKSPEGRPEAFTFRKSSTPSKEDIKSKIASLMQNRSRIEKKLQVLQAEQETL